MAVRKKKSARKKQAASRSKSSTRKKTARKEAGRKKKAAGRKKKAPTRKKATRGKKSAARKQTKARTRTTSKRGGKSSGSDLVYSDIRGMLQSQPSRNASDSGVLEAGIIVALGPPLTPRLTHARARERSAASVSDVDLRRMGEPRSGTGRDRPAPDPCRFDGEAPGRGSHLPAPPSRTRDVEQCTTSRWLHLASNLDSIARMGSSTGGSRRMMQEA